MRRISPFLFLHPNGKYYFRRMVPKHLQNKVQKKEIKKALEYDKKTSMLKVLDLVIKTDHMFARGEHNSLIEESKMNYEPNRIKLPNGIECTIENLIKAKEAGIDLSAFSPVTPTPPVNTVNTALVSECSPTLSEVFSKFVEHKKTLKKCTTFTLDAYKQKFNLLVAILGDVPINTIRRDQARLVVNTMSKLPINRNRSAKYRNLSIQQMTKMQHDKTMSDKTIKAHIEFYGSMFKFAISEEMEISKNPFNELTIANSARKEKVIPFTNSDLTKLFSGPIYEECRYTSNDHWKYWAPLLALYTGSRIGQIASLRVSDCRKIDGVWCIDFNLDEDDKTAKNEQSLRSVPIHQKLIGLGFLDFVKYVRTKNKERLFYNLNLQKKYGYYRRISDWFNGNGNKTIGYKKRRKVSNRPHCRKVFHSFRKNFATKLANKGVQDQDINATGGWSQSGTVRKHYIELEITRKLEIIEMLDFNHVLQKVTL